MVASGSTRFYSSALNAHPYSNLHSSVPNNRVPVANSHGRPRVRMPLSTELFGVFFASNRIAWNRARNFFRTKANRPMSSVGRLRRRSRAAAEWCCQFCRAPRVIRGRKEFYGSNCMDRCHTLRYWPRPVGMVAAKTEPRSPAPGDRDDFADSGAFADFFAGRFTNSATRSLGRGVSGKN